MADSFFNGEQASNTNPIKLKSMSFFIAYGFDVEERKKKGHC
jgi:hypothetical protein